MEREAELGEDDLMNRVAVLFNHNRRNLEDSFETEFSNSVVGCYSKIVNSSNIYSSILTGHSRAQECESCCITISILKEG